MSTLVMKFGGTSVGHPQAILRSAALAATNRQNKDLVVIVSALSGVTNLLMEGAHQSANDREQVINFTRSFLNRHLELISGLNLTSPCAEILTNRIKSNAILLYNLLFQAYQSGRATPDLLDEILALGELTSASIFTAILQDNGNPTEEIDARKIITTDNTYTCARVDFTLTDQNVRQFLTEAFGRGHIVVVPGFVGRSADGHTTTLGRGASDYSASIIAAALDADEIWNWTDVDGVLTVDPHLVPSARVIPNLTYSEMTRLSAHGAKVLHPDSVTPLALKNIPLRIKNSFHPQHPGTLVYSESSEKNLYPLGMGVIHTLNSDHQEVSEISIINGSGMDEQVQETLEQYQIPISSWKSDLQDDCVTFSIDYQYEDKTLKTLMPLLFPDREAALDSFTQSESLALLSTN